MSEIRNHPNIIKLESKSADILEETISKIDKAFTVLSIYGMNNRHYAWISLHTGVRKRVVKTKTNVTESKKEKVNIT